MSTLLIELAAPQQAWGSSSRFSVRSTDLAPSKSGVIGMLAAAKGLERTASLTEFDDLRFGVRIDQPGAVERDFQTTRSLDGVKSFPLSSRYYLADAVFLVGIESEDSDTLRGYRQALAGPYFPLYFGRRAFPPAGPLRTEIVDLPLAEALRGAVWRARPHHRRSIRGAVVPLELVLDASSGDRADDSRRDVPRSFDPRRRVHDWRDVTTAIVEVPHPEPRAALEPPSPRRSGSSPVSQAEQRAPHKHERLLGSPTEHDPEALLSDEEV